MLHKLGVGLPFLEISNSVEAFDIVEAAYLSAMVFTEFPENSIHILATNVVATSLKGHLAARFKGHFFLAPDNGILPLLFDDGFKDYYLIPTPQFEQKIQSVYPDFIQKLIDSGYNLDSIALKAEHFHSKSKLIPVKDQKELRGTILYVDRFGNAYSNISKQQFDDFTKGRSYSIKLGLHSAIKSISENFSNVNDGDAIAFFTEHDYLVVAIKKGNVERLLNFRKYKPLIIELE